MAGWILLGTLAAFGAFCLLWALAGWLLPGLRGFALVCMELPEPEYLSRVRWLRGLGLMDCPLIVVTEQAQREQTDMEICSRAELLRRLEWERNRFDGTGNGDHTGRHQRRGISEL